MPSTITSTFDASSEGWTVTGGVMSSAWVANGGNPGGYFGFADQSTDQDSYFRAPAAYLGNQAGLLGGTLSFSLYAPATPTYDDLADVVLTGPNGWRLYANIPQPVQGWSAHSVTFDLSTDWRVGSGSGDRATLDHIIRALQSVSDLRIRAEYVFGNEQGGLDSVAMTPQNPNGPGAGADLPGAQGIGTPVAVMTLQSDDQGHRVVELSGGGYAVVWLNSAGGSIGESLSGRIFNGDNTPAGAEFSLGVTGGTAGVMLEGVVTQGTGFLVTYGRAYYADPMAVGDYQRSFGPTGTPTSGENLVQDAVNIDYHSPVSVAVSTAGSALSVFNTGDAQGQGIGARLNGGPEFLVNTVTSGSQQGGHVVALNDGSGDFLVFWTTLVPAGQQGQFISSTGLKIGGEFSMDAMFREGQLRNGEPLALFGTMLSNDISVKDGNLYAPDGTEMGTAPEASSITALANGQFIASWVEGGTLFRQVFATTAPNFIYGTNGDDALNGANQTGFFVGFTGSDTVSYETANAAVAVRLDDPAANTGAAAGDRHGLSIENLIGTDFADDLAGNERNNVLDGGVGADVMSGRLGNDTYRVDNSGDVINEYAGEGTDRVLASTDFHLSFEDSIEFLEAANAEATTALRLIGNSSAQTITGNAGTNIIEGRGGADTLIGLGGNDSYYLTSGTEIIQEIAGDGVDRILSAASYVLAAGVNVEILSTDSTVGTAAINLTGNELSQTIYGNANSNIIDGKGGADFMQGFGGNDHYYVDNAGDTVVEAAGAAGGMSDSIEVSFSYALAAGVAVESLSITGVGTAAINLTGNEFYQFIFGNAGNNIIDGKGDADNMAGGGGNDSYYVDNAGDWVGEADGVSGGTADRVLSSVNYTLAARAAVEILSTTTIAGVNAINLTGNSFMQYIYGNAGANIIDGKGGGDTMTGYGGNDWYTVYSAADQVIEAVNGGSDRVYSAVSYTLAAAAEVEFLSTNFTVGTGAINLTGNGFVQAIYGNAGANIIDGKGGADTMVGNGGNDIYSVDNTADQVIEAAGGGTDRVYAAVNYTLAAAAEAEFLSTNFTAGVGAINLTGNAFAQSIYGNAGANTLDGGGGIDGMVGNGGNDQFYVDNAADQVVETAGGGNDRVLASVNYTLAAAAQVEILTTTLLAGTEAINLTGNGFGQWIYGNAGANVINGKAGADIMIGYDDADIFVFDTALGASNIDIIADYYAAADTIRLENATFTALTALGTLASGAFMSNSTGVATQTDDRIIYESDTGRLFYDADGLNGAVGIQFATLIGTPVIITNADFVVV